jgi:hypothetical protein
MSGTFRTPNVMPMGLCEVSMSVVAADNRCTAGGGDELG